jgi:hypothetical protein
MSRRWLALRIARCTELLPSSNRTSYSLSLEGLSSDNAVGKSQALKAKTPTSKSGMRLGRRIVMGIGKLTEKDREWCAITHTHYHVDLDGTSPECMILHRLFA